MCSYPFSLPFIYCGCDAATRKRIFLKSAQFYRKFHSAGEHTKSAISLIGMSRREERALHIPGTYRTKFNTARQNFEAPYIILLVLLR